MSTSSPTSSGTRTVRPSKNDERIAIEIETDNARSPENVLRDLDGGAARRKF